MGNTVTQKTSFTQLPNHMEMLHMQRMEARGAILFRLPFRQWIESAMQGLSLANQYSESQSRHQKEAEPRLYVESQETRSSQVSEAGPGSCQ